MGNPTRLIVPGGGMTSQELLELVAWAGGQGLAELTMGDQQDWLAELDPTPSPQPPGRLRWAQKGSIQSSAYGTFPHPARPWLTMGVWMDLLASLGEPGGLDVQVLDPEGEADFPRMGHLRLVAQKEPHRWVMTLRRPGSTALLSPRVSVVDTGSIPHEMNALAQAWQHGREEPWNAALAAVSAEPAFRTAAREGFLEGGPDSFSFGLWSARGRFSVTKLRDLAWMAAEAGSSRIWLTSDRTLLFPSIPKARRAQWVQWTRQSAWSGRHGDLDHGVRVVGNSAGAWAAREQLLAFLRERDQQPPGTGILVCDGSVNRADGVVGLGWPVLIPSSHSWAFRSLFPSFSGEGPLAQVLFELSRQPQVQKDAAASSNRAPSGPPEHQCRDCQTRYSPLWGDPRANIPFGVAWDDLPATWSCPVCGGPRERFDRIEDETPENLDLVT